MGDELYDYALGIKKRNGNISSTKHTSHNSTAAPDEPEDLRQGLLDLLLHFHLLLTLTAVLILLLLVLLLRRVASLLPGIVLWLSAHRIRRLIMWLSVLLLIVLSWRVVLAGLSIAAGQVDIHPSFVMFGGILESQLLAYLLHARLDLLEVVCAVVSLAYDTAAQIN